MSPSQTIIRQAQQTLTTTDQKGRKLVVRQLTALDTLRLFKAAGSELSQNASWLSMAGLAFSLLDPTWTVDGLLIFHRIDKSWNFNNLRDSLYPT